MGKDIKELLLVSLEKVQKSIDSTLEAVERAKGFDPYNSNNYEEQAPFDVLTSRFTRAV